MAAAPNTKVIYLIRHAESMENVRIGAFDSLVRSIRSGRCPSCSDVCTVLPLIRLNKAQLRKEGFLSQAAIQLVVHSPLERAVRTFEALLGDWRGATPVVELPVLVERTPCEAITGRGFVERVDDFRDWLSQRPESRIAVVGHGQFFRKLLRGCNSDGSIGNAEVRRCRFVVATKSFDRCERVYCPRVNSDESGEESAS